MLKHKGGDTVKAGFYWNAKEWEATIVPKAGGPLPGGEDVVYYRTPLLVLLVVLPIMGAAFAMFLPFIGMYMLAAFLTGRLRRSKPSTPPAAEAGVETKKAA
jgi:hypothetical protein